MTSKRTRFSLGAALAVLAAAAVVPPPLDAGQGSEELAVRRFESGLAFARDGNYEEALEDFQAVTNLYPASSVADNAILEIARYHLEVGGDVNQAVTAATGIVDSQAYSQSDAAPEAYVILGRAALARGRTENDIEDAISNFQRGLRLHPDAPAVPQGLFYIAEGQRWAGRLDEALAVYRRVVAEHPSSRWAIQARLGAGTMAAFMDDPVRAMEQFQLVRDEFPERPEAIEALARTTILYRLFVRPRASTYTITPPSDPAGRTGRTVIAMASTTDGNVVLATDRGVALLRPSATPLPAVREPRGLGVGPDGEVVVIERGSLQRRGSDLLQFVVPRREEPRSLREVDAVVATSTGEWLVADREAQAVQRFTRGGAYLGVYADVRAERLAIDPLDHVAVLDNDERIYVYDAGRQIAQLTTRGDAYRIDNPVDLAFDVFGHLYVLDREGLYVFGRDRRLLTRFPQSENTRGAFDRATALTIDRFGRLYVADERDRLVFALQ